MIETFYLWIKAAHLISIISWMAGLLYLPRLLVYHCSAPVGSKSSEMLKVMERKLLKFIMNPAMIASWLFGILMLFSAENLLTYGWMQVKFFCVLLLTASHMMMAKWRKDFAADRNSRGDRFFRIANEVPTILMVLIIIMVIIKPV